MEHKHTEGNVPNLHLEIASYDDGNGYFTNTLTVAGVCSIQFENVEYNTETLCLIFYVSGNEVARIMDELVVNEFLRRFGSPKWDI